MSTPPHTTETCPKRFALLVTEQELVDNLVQLLTEERHALVHVDSTKILEFSSQKVALLERLQELREQRGKVRKADLNDRAFRRAAATLKASLKEARALLERNRVLISNMERILKGAVAAFNRALSEGNLYNQDGSERFMIAAKTTSSTWG